MKLLSFTTILRLIGFGAGFGILFAAVGAVAGLDVRYVTIVAGAGAGVFSAILLRRETSNGKAE